MTAQCHFALVLEHHIVIDQHPPHWDEESMTMIEGDFFERPPTPEEVANLPDAVVYDLVAAVRGISRSHAAFERYTCERLGDPLPAPEPLQSYWSNLTPETLPDEYTFEQATSIRSAAEECFGEDYANDVMRATCRAWDAEQFKLYPASIRALELLLSAQSRDDLPRRRDDVG